MGNTQSDLLQPSETPNKPTFSGFIRSADGFVCISKESFLHKFPSGLQEPANLLWTAYTMGEDMFLHEYSLLLKDLAFEQNKPRFFIDLLGKDTLSFKEVTELFLWFSLGYEINELLLNAANKSLLSYSENEESVTKYDFLSWLGRNFPDAGDDLAKFVSYCLNHDCPEEYVLPCLDVFSTPLLTKDTIWFLSFILPSAYKRPGETILRNMAPLEMEQLVHLHCLYNSTLHGLSATKVKALTFDYEGPIILLLRTEEYFFCLAIDEGLRESWQTYGGSESCLFQLLPTFAKLVTGRSLGLSSGGLDTGIVYSHFTTKTSKRGLSVGHQPLVASVLEVSEGFDRIRVSNGQPIRLTAAEVWAAGSSVQMTKLNDQKSWEQKEVEKAKNSKTKLTEGWQSSGDRHLLDMAGVKVRHSDAIGPMEPETS